jgi:hypothetical protein
VVVSAVSTASKRDPIPTSLRMLESLIRTWNPVTHLCPRAVYLASTR